MIIETGEFMFIYPGIFNSNDGLYDFCLRFVTVFLIITVIIGGGPVGNILRMQEEADRYSERPT